MLHINLYNLHLAFLAIEYQSESPSVQTLQIVRFMIRRFPLLLVGTPAHAITKAIFAKHYYRFINRFFLKCILNLCNSMIRVKRSGLLVHHIAQIRKTILRIGVICLLPISHLLRIIVSPYLCQFVNHLPAPL